METHTVSNTRTRLQVDAQVNHILDTTLQRESKLSSTQNKLRTTSVAEKTFREVMEMNHLQEEAPISTGVRTEFINTVQTGVTWRHDTLLKYFVSSVDTEKFRVFSDIQSHQAAGGGSIPPEICVTNLGPDIDVINVENNTVNLLELTCPSEQNIDIRHKQKFLKYDHSLRDIPQSTLTCFKISSKGYISPRNHTSLNFIHKFLKKNIKLTTFKKNISALNIYTSYHIWLCRSDPAFIVPPLLSPPFSDQVAPTGRGPGQ